MGRGSQAVPRQREEAEKTVDAWMTDTARLQGGDGLGGWGPIDESPIRRRDVLNLRE